MDSSGEQPTQRRLIAPVYEFDPSADYEDPNVQAWAQYYAAGGTDLSGSVYFMSIPGLTTAPGVAAPVPSTSTTLSHTEPSGQPHRQSQQPVGPRGRRRSTTKKGILGLLEFLHITKRKRASNDVSPLTPNPEPSERQTEKLPMQENFSQDDDDEPENVGSLLAIHSLETTPTSDASLPPTYAESIDDFSSPVTLPSTLSPYSSGKASFSPSVSFGETNELSRPLPSPSPDIPQWPNDKAPPYTTSTVHTVFHAIQEEDDEDEEDVLLEHVPSRLSHIEETISPSPDKRNSSKPLYHNLMTLLLQEVSPISSTQTNSVIETLNEYAESLRSFDSVTSLIRAHIYRGSLLQIASVLGLSEDARIRRALQTDETDIADLVHRVALSDSDRQAVIALEGDDAQNFLNVVQDVLDRGFLFPDSSDNTQARRLLMKLSANCYKLPSKLFIEGVARSDEHATFGGGFGDVFRGHYKGQVVALKRMRIFQRDHDLPQKRRKFCQEALTWQSLKHAYIVPFLGIVAEEFPTVLCMVSPWMRHGTVLKHLVDNGRANVNKRLHEIAQGLAYLHSRNIVHGDLRGSNILINDEWQACLTDFGLTVFNDATPATYTSRHEGSVRWMAPELYMPQRFGVERFRLTPASDIYAFACVCIELYTGQAPFHDIYHDPAIILKVTEGKRPDRPGNTNPLLSDKLWGLIQACWSQKFSDRPVTPTVVERMSELSSTVQLLPNVVTPSPDVADFDKDIGVQNAENFPARTSLDSWPTNKRVHFDLPSDSVIGSTGRVLDGVIDGVWGDSKTERRLYTDAVVRRDLAQAHLREDELSTRGFQFAESLPKPPPQRRLVPASVPRFTLRDDGPVPLPKIRTDLDDDNWSSSSSSTDDSRSAQDIASSDSSLFDPGLLVSPRKEISTAFPPLIPIVEIRDILDDDPEYTSSDSEDYEESKVARIRGTAMPFALSDISRSLKEMGVSSLDNDEATTLMEDFLKLYHDPMDNPLPLECLTSDILDSLRSQGFWKLGERRIASSCGVITMLTKCYSPSCLQTNMTPCYSLSCPRWGVNGATSKPTLRIANLPLDAVPIPVAKTVQAVRPLPTVRDGDLLNDYWDLVEALDSAFDKDFRLPDFSKAVVQRVAPSKRTIFWPNRPSTGDIWLVFFIFLSLPFIYTTLLVSPIPLQTL